MSYYKVLFLLIASQLLCDGDGQRATKFFRNDYKYMESTQSFYKIHTLHKNWKDAKRTCALEGATFFYPEDQTEADAVIDYMNETTPFHWVFIGVSDNMSKGVYETFDGMPVQNIYHNWAPGEPNGGHPQDCVILRRDGFLRDENCATPAPFICKKTLSSLQWNEYCNMPNMDYRFNEALGKCYKFHLAPRNWTDAYAVCSAEQSYLAIVNTQDEMDYLVNMTAAAHKDNIDGYYLRGAVHLGFHNRDDEGWVTIKGTSLEDSGYTQWSYAQPDGRGEERCGSMFYGGELNDIGCWVRMFFICEHDVDILNEMFDERFSDVE